MSQAHHVDSLDYNLAHARAHLDTAEKHAKALRKQAQRVPGIRAELRRVQR